MVHSKHSISVDASRKTFKKFLLSKGLRVTNRRLFIFDAANHQTHHFTAEELIDHSCTIDKSISRATVYRTIPLLVQSGVIREINVGHDHKYYITNKETDTFQAQLICNDCEKIFETDAPFMEWYGKAVSKKLGMEVTTQRLQVEAACTEYRKSHFCRKKSGVTEP